MAASAQADSDLQSLMEEVRKLVKDTKEELNILVVGPVGVGKSTLINSLHMAVAQKWNEFAEYGGATGTNNTYYMHPFTMFERQFMSNPIEGYGETIKLWDFAGMENLADETYTELIGLALEGRVPAKTCVLTLLKNEKLTTAMLHKRFPYKESAQERRFHRVIMVCDAKRDIPENLVEAVKRATTSEGGRTIPRFLLMSKLDSVGDSSEYGERKEEARNLFQLKGNNERFFETGLYSDLNSNCSRAPNRRFNRNQEIDLTLLAMWVNLLDPARNAYLSYDRRRERCTLS